VRIAIVGDGVSGGYLYRLLKQKFAEDDIEVFGKKNGTACLIRSCGWLVNYPLFLKMGEEVNIDFNRYVTGRFSAMLLQDKKIPANVATINKPLLVEELLEGTRVEYSFPDMSNYDRVIDATGRRMLLPSIESNDNEISWIYQCRHTGNEHSIPEGYFGRSCILDYSIPLGDGTTHSGFGVFNDNIKTRKAFSKLSTNENVKCSCISSLWLGGIRLPILNNKVIGIGESIGLVDPISGFGIIPAMDSALALVKYWYNLNGYEKYIKSEYSYMQREAVALRSNSRIVSIFKLVLSGGKSARLIGINTTVRDLLGPLRRALLERLRVERLT